MLHGDKIQMELEKFDPLNKHDVCALTLQEVAGKAAILSQVPISPATSGSLLLLWSDKLCSFQTSVSRELNIHF